jgi:hypothetical protein
MSTELPWFHRTIIAVVNEQDRECVRHVQQVLNIPVTGQMDESTRMAVIRVQTLFNLNVNGSINEATAQQIERLRRWETL